MVARMIGSTVLAGFAAAGLTLTVAAAPEQTAPTSSGQRAQAPVTAAPPASAAPTPVRRASARPPANLRTEDGHPNIQGVWSYATVTPLERNPTLGDKAEFEDEEQVAAFEKTARRNFDDRSGPATQDVGRAYNDFWWDRGTTVAGKQTSLVVDPPNGRIPPTTPEAQKRAQERNAARVPRTSEADNPEDRSLWERCITRALPTLPGPYNNNIQIVQTKDHVVIVNEMIHEARIIPTDGRPHGKIRQWHGDSIGRWDGDTLVVETINFTDKTSFRGSNLNLKLTERYKRLDAETLQYDVTIEDPTTWAQPWTVRIPMTFNEEGIFEYACHEANYGLEGILKGARLQDKLRAAGEK